MLTPAIFPIILTVFQQYHLSRHNIETISRTAHPCQYSRLLNLLPEVGITLYPLPFSLSPGYIALLMAVVWITRLLKNNLMDKVFNNENEAFNRKQDVSKMNTH